MGLVAFLESKTMSSIVIKGLSAAVLAVSLASPAWSAPIVGTLDPGVAAVPTPGSRTLSAFTPLGAFEQQYNFQSVNGGNFSGTFSWSGFGNVTGFGAALYSSDSLYGPGSKIADYSASSPRGLSLDWNSITSGYYYILASGTAVGVKSGDEFPVRVSGEFAMKIAEPSVIGLLGLGLAGIGFIGARRRG
jgi:hypothetical protein